MTAIIKQMHNESGTVVYPLTSSKAVYYKGEALESYLDKLQLEGVGPSVEIEDSLTSKDATKALSAKQGNTLKGIIDAFKDDAVKRSDFSPADSGKILSYDNGSIIAVDMPTAGEGGGGEVEIVNNLNSTNPYAALSALQGKVLNDSKAPKNNAILTGNTNIGEDSLIIDQSTHKVSARGFKFDDSGRKADRTISPAGDESCSIENMEYIDCENLTVRGSLNVYELIANKVRATNGYLYVSDSDVIKTINTNGANCWVVFEEGNFRKGDIILLQTGNGKGGIDSARFKVVAYTEANKTFQLQKTDSSVITELKEGSYLVRIDSNSDDSRKTGVLLSPYDGAYIDFYKGNGTGKNPAISTSVGDLDHLGKAGVSGLGFYSDNCYLKGQFTLENGKSVASEMAAVSKMASDAVAAANQLNSSVDGLTDKIEEAIGDGVLSEAEKKAIKEAAKSVGSIYKATISSYTELMKSPYLLQNSTERAELAEAKLNLDSTEASNPGKYQLLVAAIDNFLKASSQNLSSAYTKYTDAYDAFDVCIERYEGAVEAARSSINMKMQIDAQGYAKGVSDALTTYKGQTNSRLDKSEAGLESLVQQMGDLQGQVDGAVEIYSYTYAPTLTNYPASEWTTNELRRAHVGDYFDYMQLTDEVDENNNKVYKVQRYKFVCDMDTVDISRTFDADFYMANPQIIAGELTHEMPAASTMDLTPRVDPIYSWEPITDSAGAEALALVRDALGIAETKTRVIYSSTEPDVSTAKEGDLWINPSKGDTISVFAINATTKKGEWVVINDTRFRLGLIASDGFISIEEKAELRREQIKMARDLEVYRADANAYSVPASALAAFEDAHRNLDDQYDHVLLITNGKDTSLTANQENTYKTIMGTYYTEKTKVATIISKAISDKAIGELDLDGVNLFVNSELVKGTGTSSKAYISDSITIPGTPRHITIACTNLNAYSIKLGFTVNSIHPESTQVIAPGERGSFTYAWDTTFGNLTPFIKSANNATLGAYSLGQVKLEVGKKATTWCEASADATLKMIATTNGIVQKLGDTGISIDAKTITLSGDKVKFTNKAGDKTLVHIDNNTGALHAQDAVISGNISATTGKFGKMKIEGNNLVISDDNSSVSFINNEGAVSRITNSNLEIADSGAVAVVPDPASTEYPIFAGVLRSVTHTCSNTFTLKESTYRVIMSGGVTVEAKSLSQSLGQNIEFKAELYAICEDNANESILLDSFAGILTQYNIRIPEIFAGSTFITTGGRWHFEWVIQYVYTKGGAASSSNSLYISMANAVASANTVSYISELAADGINIARASNKRFQAKVTEDEVIVIADLPTKARYMGQLYRTLDGTVKVQLTTP